MNDDSSSVHKLIVAIDKNCDRIPKTKEELNQIALDIVEGKIFTSCQVKDFALVKSVFMPLMFLKSEDVEELIQEECELFYEYLSEAGSHGINGYPTFMSAQYLVKDEVEYVNAKIAEFRKTREAMLAS